MTSRTLPLAITLGLLAALMTLAPLRVPGIGGVASFFSAVPLFYLGLAYGLVPAAVGAASATVAAVLFTGIGGGASIALMVAGPVLLVTWFALQHREVDGETQYYPLAEIFARLVAYIAAVVIVLGVFLGVTADGLSEMVAELFSQVASQTEGLEVTSPQIASQSALAARLLPFLMPAALLLSLLASLSLASTFARGRGLQARPRDDVPADAGLPFWCLGLFALGIVLSLLGGSVALVGAVVAGAFGFALALVGLATIHYATRGRQSRGLILTMLYLSLFLFAPLWVLVVALGLAETVLSLRARLAGEI